MERLISLKGGVKPDEFKGQRRVVVDVLKQAGAVGKKLVSIDEVVKRAKRRLKLNGPTPTQCVNYHVRGLREEGLLIEDRITSSPPKKPVGRVTEVARKVKKAG